MMDFNDADFLAFAWWISNIVGLIFVFVALKSTRLARLMFAILFGYASLVNYNLSHHDPNVYLDYADHSIVPYADFIRGWFSGNITVFVTAIAAGQLVIAIGMLLNRAMVTLACIGVISFLAGIAPLGLYAAFPFSLTVSVAAFLVIRNDRKDYLWKRGDVAPILSKKELA